MSTGKSLHRQYQERMLGEVGSRFLANHAMCTRPWANRRNDIPDKVHAIGALEFPFYDYPDYPNYHQDKGSKLQGRSVDVVFVCGAGKSTTYHDENHTIAVEVKSSMENLICDPKIPEYFGRTDYIYLAVPDDLVIPGLIRTLSWDHVGVVSLTTGKIYKPAKRQVVPFEERKRILERLLLEKLSYSLHGDINPQKDNGLFIFPDLQRVDWATGVPKYIEHAR